MTWETPTGGDSSSQQGSPCLQPPGTVLSATAGENPGPLSISLRFSYSFCLFLKSLLLQETKNFLVNLAFFF